MWSKCRRTGEFADCMSACVSLSGLKKSAGESNCRREETSLLHSYISLPGCTGTNQSSSTDAPPHRLPRFTTEKMTTSLSSL